MLQGMAASTKERPIRRAVSIGAFIKARRSYLGLRAEDLVAKTGGVINLKLLSKLENDHVHPGTLRVNKLRALLAVLELTPEEFERETGVEPPTPSTDWSDIPGSRSYQPTLHIPIAGTVSAGIQAVNMHEDFDDHLLVDPMLPSIRGRRPEGLIALRVNGDSMVSEGARQKVSHGAHVVVEVGAVPEDRDLVVAWLPARDTAVLKQYRESGDTVLRSLNPLGPVFRLSDEPIDVRGVVRLVLSDPNG